MIDYLDIARQALERWHAQAQPAPRTDGVSRSVRPAAPESVAIPAIELWPESLKELARECGEQTRNPEAAKAEVWISYSEFLAARLNKLFDEHGRHGPHCQQNRAPDEQCLERYHRSRPPANVRPETIRDGIEHATRPGRRS